MARGSSSRKPLTDLGNDNGRTRLANSAFTSISSRTRSSSQPKGDQKLRRLEQNLASESKKSSSSSGDQSPIASKPPPPTRAKAKVGRYASTKRGNCDDDGSGHRALENISTDHHNDKKKSDDDDGSDESVDLLEGGGVNKRNDLVPRAPFQLILDNVEQVTSCITAEEDPTHLINSLDDFPFIQKALWGLQRATKEDAGSDRVVECYKKLNRLLEDLCAESKMEVLEGSAVNGRNGGNEEEDSSDDERCGGGQKSFVANRGKKKDEINLVGEPPRSPKKKSNKSTDDSIIDNVTQKCTAKSTPPMSSTEATSTSMRSYPYKQQITLINPDGSEKGTRTVTIKRQSHDPDVKPDEEWIESVVLALLAKGGEEAMNDACAFLYWIGRNLATVLEQRMCKGHGVNQSEFRKLVGLSPKDFAYYLCSFLPDSQSAAMLLLASLQGDHLNPKDELFLRYNRGSNGRRGTHHHSNFVPLSRYLNETKSNHSVMNNTMLPISVEGEVMTPDQFDSGETTFSHWLHDASIGVVDPYDQESFEEGGDRTKEAVMADLEKSTNKLKKLEEEIKKARLERMGFQQELHRIDPSMTVDAEALFLSPGFGPSFAAEANRHVFGKIVAEHKRKRENMERQELIQCDCDSVYRLMDSANFMADGMQSIITEYGPKVLEIQKKNATASNASASGDGSSLHGDYLEEEEDEEEEEEEEEDEELQLIRQERVDAGRQGGIRSAERIALDAFEKGNGVFVLGCRKNNRDCETWKVGERGRKECKACGGGKHSEWVEVGPLDESQIKIAFECLKKGRGRCSFDEVKKKLESNGNCLEEQEAAVCGNIERARKGALALIKGNAIRAFEAEEDVFVLGCKGNRRCRFWTVGKLGTKLCGLCRISHNKWEAVPRAPNQGNNKLNSISEIRVACASLEEGCSVDEVMEKLKSNDDSLLNNKSVEVEEEDEERTKNSYRTNNIGNIRSKAIAAFDADEDVFVLDCIKSDPSCRFWTVGKWAVGNKGRKTCPDCKDHKQWTDVSRSLDKKQISLACELLEKNYSIRKLKEEFKKKLSLKEEEEEE